MRLLQNIALGHPCDQSSADPTFSQGRKTADQALTSQKTGEYSFHTDFSDNAPWWQIDLGAPVDVDAVVVYNRERFRHRAQSLQLWHSADGEIWQRCFDNFDLPTYERMFGGIRTGARTIWTRDLNTRYLRIALVEKEALHLDAIEIYSSLSFQEDDRSAAKFILGQAASGALDIARTNLSQSGLSAPLVAEVASQIDNRDDKVASTVLEYMAETGAYTDPAQFDMLGLAAPEAGYAALVRGFLKAPENKDKAKAAYAELSRLSPDHPELRSMHERLLASSGKSSEKVIKLIIWDLDDTLWDGTLAEGDEVVLKEHLAELIRQSTTRGIINSIVSKNDDATAKAKLAQFGLTDYFIHPVISFQPKGELVKELIKSLQLREQNVLFIDDNPLNLNEVKFYCPKIQVADARDAETETMLRALVASNKPDEGKRHREYQILAKKLDEAAAFGGENSDFLRQSQIKIALVRGNNNFRFATRIEELVNRSNQMNFLKSRIPEGTGSYLVGDAFSYDPYSVFVKDRFGSYGLVGFALVSLKTKKLEHFAFSCRIMSMKVENVVMSYVVERYGPQDCEIQPERPDYITVVEGATWEFKADMDEAANASVKDIMVMANCQSGIIAHYLGLASRTDAEQAPNIFTLNTMAYRAREYSTKYNVLIYGVFVEYMREYWNGKFSAGEFRRTLSQSLRSWAKDNAKVFLIVPPPSERIVENVDASGPACTFTYLNGIVRECAALHANVSVIDLVEFIQDEADVGADIRHYSRPMLRRVAEYLRPMIPPAAPTRAATAKSKDEESEIKPRGVYRLWLSERPGRREGVWQVLDVRRGMARLYNPHYSPDPLALNLEEGEILSAEELESETDVTFWSKYSDWDGLEAPMPASSRH